jgi:hypothetical protein
MTSKITDFNKNKIGVVKLVLQVINTNDNTTGSAKLNNNEKFKII